MKKSLLPLMLFSLFLCGCVNISGTEDGKAADWKFTYPDGKLKAVTFSYDDGVIEDRELIKIFDKYNIKATFNISLGKAPKKPDRFIQAPEIKELYKNHEIASHGFFHRTMILLKDKALTSEIADNQQAIAKVLGAEPPGFAYPYGRHTSKKAPTRIYEALAKHGLRYARTCQRKADFDLPSNWLAWSPNGHHNAGLAICKRYKEFKSDKMSVCYIWGHSYEFVRPKPRWEIIENICKLIANQPDIWYATNGEIALYVQACEAAKKASKFPEIVNPTDMELHLLVDGRPVILPPKSTKKFHSCLIKRRPTAAHCAQSLGKSADFRLRFTTPRQASSEKVHLATAESLRSRVLQIRLDLPATLHHTASTDWKQAVSSATASGREI